MVRLFIIGFLLFMPMTAISQPPVPSTSKKIEKPNTEPQEKHRQPDKSNSGTVVPHNVPTSPTNEEHENKSPSDWWLIGFTAGLFIVTAILAWYTARLWKTTKKSLDITKETVDLARQEFISTHRPRLIVRNVSVKTHFHPLMSIENGKPLQFEWVVVNVGDSPCEIIESSAQGLFDTRPFDTRTLYSKEPTPMDGKKIVPGGLESFSLISDIVFNGPPVQSILRTENKAIYFFGFIVYRDEIGNNRRTAFCRRYDLTEKRFMCDDSPDFEYTD